MQRTQNVEQRPGKIYRITVLLTPWLFDRIQAEARVRLTSRSAVVRETLAHRYRDHDERDRPRE
jgi:hypothetical protein